MAEAERLTSFIGGEMTQHDGGTLELVRPEDGTVTTVLVEAGPDGVRKAVAKALAAFPAIRTSTLHQRSLWLHAAATSLRDSAERIASVVCDDIGKPIRLALIEVRRGADLIEACATAALTLGGEVVPLSAAAKGAGHFGFTRRIPYGVIGAITPFNAPVNLLLQKVAPAIAAGNVVVAKPAPAGSRTALALASLFHEAGWPAGLFNVVTGGRETALALAADPEVHAVSFTGGTEAGEDISRVVGVRKFVCELGSNAANVVMADCNLEDAAVKIAAAGFEASGQQCISAQRILVEREAYGPFVSLLLTAVGRLRVGPAADPATDIGPMVSRAAADRVMAMCREAIEKGARYALEPRREGCTVSPGILLDTPLTARLWTEEAFGPVVVVQSFTGVDEALSLANDSRFGLQGAVFTSSLKTAMRFSEDFDVGALWINEASRYRLDMYPFGGVKMSGTGREGAKYAIDEFSQVKFTGVRP